MVSNGENDAKLAATLGQFAHDPESKAMVLSTGGHDGMLDVASISNTSGFAPVAGPPVIVIVSPVLYPEPTAVAIILKTGKIGDAVWYTIVNCAPVPHPEVVPVTAVVVPVVQLTGSVVRIADKNAPPISCTVRTIAGALAPPTDVLAVLIVTVSPIA